jgi:hypothetical protein
MAGEAQPPGVGKALSIEDEQIRWTFQALPGSSEHWQFPEGEQARDIGEAEGDGSALLRNGGQRLSVEDDEAPVPDLTPALGGDIRASNPSDPESRGCSQHHSLTQGVLQRHGLLGSDVPAMQEFQFHGPSPAANIYLSGPQERALLDA